MSNYAIIERTIRKALDDGKRKFVIYPFGEDGMLTKNIIEMRYGITSISIIDNVLARYRNDIYDASVLDEMDITDTAILFTSTNLKLANTIKEKHYSHAVYYIFDVDPNPKIGKCSYGDLLAYESKFESVGAFCSFAPGTAVVGNHPLDFVTTASFIYSGQYAAEYNSPAPRFSFSDFTPKCKIGNDVWFGRNVIVTNGANIGNGVIAGAGAIITKDIPDYAIVVGVPAKILRYRFNEEQIEKLNSIEWWNWPLKTIVERYDDFIHIDTFLEKYYKPK